MDAQRTMINYLKKALETERAKVKKLRKLLELENTAVEIERILNKEDVQKYKKIAVDISKEYMMYAHEHPDDSSDSDSTNYDTEDE
jgi:hypothetical protein